MDFEAGKLKKPAWRTSMKLKCDKLGFLSFLAELVQKLSWSIFGVSWADTLKPESSRAPACRISLKCQNLGISWVFWLRGVGPAELRELQKLAQKFCAWTPVQVKDSQMAFEKLEGYHYCHPTLMTSFRFDGWPTWLWGWRLNLHHHLVVGLNHQGSCPSEHFWIFWCKWGGNEWQQLLEGQQEAASSCCPSSKCFPTIYAMVVMVVGMLYG